MATRTVNGRVISLQPIPAMESFALQPLLAPAVGKILGIVIGFLGNDDGLSLETISLDTVISSARAFPPAVLSGLISEAASIFGAIKPSDLKTILRGLLYGGIATVDGVPMWPVAGDDAKFNALFAGRTRDLWLILFFAVQENYPDFFPRPAEKGGTPVASPSKTSDTSPGAGPSTGSSGPVS